MCFIWIIVKLKISKTQNLFYTFTIKARDIEINLSFKAKNLPQNLHHYFKMLNKMNVFCAC